MFDSRSLVVEEPASTASPGTNGHGLGTNGHGPGANGHEPTMSVMGLPFHAIDERTLIQAFLEGVKAHRGGWIVTPNLDILRQFSRNPESRELVLAASHRVADGAPIVWATRLAGMPVPERVPGSDLVLSMPEAAGGAGLSVFLLGGNPGVAAAAAEQLRVRCPGLRDVQSYCPPFGYEDDPEELEKIKEELRSAQPDLALIGLGFPKQERLIHLLRAEMPSVWFVGVGISLSFLAGDQPRAPVVLQRLGLEWIHRLCHEPRRLFRRYVVQGLPFGLKLFGWALRHRLRGGRGAAALPAASQNGGAPAATGGRAARQTAPLGASGRVTGDGVIGSSGLGERPGSAE